MKYSKKYNEQTLQDRFALKVVGHLSRGAETLPHDISERLRAARARAVSKRKVAVFQTANAGVRMGNAAALSGGPLDDMGWWGRIGVVIPMVMLVVGILTINLIQDDAVRLGLTKQGLVLHC